MDGVKRVSSARAQSGIFYVNWWLMNHCSWACSYCDPIIRSGSIDLPYLRHCQQFVDQAQLHAKSQQRRTAIEFTGGEVTEWTDFLQLLTYAHRQGCETQFRTNANVSIADWHQLVSVTDRLQMEWHPENTAAAHFLLCVNSAVTAGVSVTVNINMVETSWADSMALYDKITAKWPQIRVNKRLLFQDPTHNTRPLDYTPQHLMQLKRQHGDIQIETADSVKYTDFQTMVIEGANRFEGYQCSAGLEQVIVDAWGRVYRGHCRAGGFMGNIKHADIVWPQQAKICSVPVCRNSFDILATKLLSH